MQLSETVTFGGSGLDRAAHIRGDAPALAALLKTARMLPVWRGKPLISGVDRDQAGWLPADHVVFEDAKEAPVFLGLDEDGTGFFAHDISNWVPEDAGDTPDVFFDTSEQSHSALDADSRFAELRGVMTGLNAREAELIATAKAILNWHDTHPFCAKCGAPSQIAMAGWQRDCTTCDTKHFPRTDPVVIMLITHENSTLMGRSPHWPEGMYSCLAGFVEPGETIEAAVRREVFEEAGVRVGRVDYRASQPWPFPASLMIGCHGHATSTDIRIDPVEIEDARWVSREKILEAFAGNTADMKPARAGSIAHFLLLNWLKDKLY